MSGTLKMVISLVGLIGLSLIALLILVVQYARNFSEWFERRHQKPKKHPRNSDE